MRRIAPLAAVTGLAAFAGPAVADVRFEGRTSQGRQAILVTEDDGVPKRAKIGWQAPYRRSGSRPTGSTGFRRPLDLSGPRRSRVLAVARRGGRVIDRCAVRGVRWSVRR